MCTRVSIWYETTSSALSVSWDHVANNYFIDCGKILLLPQTLGCLVSLLRSEIYACHAYNLSYFGLWWLAFMFGQDS